MEQNDQLQPGKLNYAVASYSIATSVIDGIKLMHGMIMRKNKVLYNYVYNHLVYNELTCHTCHGGMNFGIITK